MSVANDLRTSWTMSRERLAVRETAFVLNLALYVYFMSVCQLQARSYISALSDDITKRPSEWHVIYHIYRTK